MHGASTSCKILGKNSEWFLKKAVTNEQTDGQDRLYRPFGFGKSPPPLVCKEQSKLHHSNNRCMQIGCAGWWS